jgi:hypothetical protein
MKYFAPLKIFIWGNILLLITFPFFPAIGQVADQLKADTAAHAATFWGWSWIMSQGMVKWLIYAVFEGGVWLATFMAFWKMKNDNR